jgi:hypothetical protein
MCLSVFVEANFDQTVPIGGFGFAASNAIPGNDSSSFVLIGACLTFGLVGFLSKAFPS